MATKAVDKLFGILYNKNSTLSMQYFVLWVDYYVCEVIV